MKININTPVKGHYLKVYKAFDRDLFEFLKPKGAKMEIVDFTGSKKGDKVHIKFLSPVKTDWISEIVEDHEDSDQAFFLDVGTILPWPLKKWMHKHAVLKAPSEMSVISDQINYKTSNIILDLLMYPVMYFAFYQRRSLYKKYFNNLC